MVTLVIDHAAARADAEHHHEHPHEHAPQPRDTAPSRERVVMSPVSVNGVAISRKAIAAEVQNAPARTPAEGWFKATLALVVRELLLQEAQRLSISADPRLEADGRHETEEEALIRALLEQEVRTPEADEEALRRFYDNNRRRFFSAPLWEAEHILCAARREDAAAFAVARQRAEALAAMLSTAPERFAELARAQSDCPSAGVGGSLGQLGPGDTTPEFEAALKALEPGVISQPVETRYGVHLIRANRHVEGRALPFEAVREQIAAYLGDHVSRAAQSQYIALLIGRADIQGIALGGAQSPLVQ